MATWLVCEGCGVKEWLQPHTPLVDCKRCHLPRYAENDEGKPMVLWSVQQDPTKWNDGVSLTSMETPPEVFEAFERMLKRQYE